MIRISSMSQSSTDTLAKHASYTPNNLSVSLKPWVAQATSCPVYADSSTGTAVSALTSTETPRPEAPSTPVEPPHQTLDDLWISSVHQAYVWAVRTFGPRAHVWAVFFPYLG